MHGAPIDEPPGFAPDVQDGWDSSLEELWQLEQQGSDSAREPEQQDSLHSTGMQAASRIANSGDLPAGLPPTATHIEATGAQRRLQTRKMAQKRFRMREKVCTILLSSKWMHAGYLLIWYSSAGT